MSLFQNVYWDTVAETSDFKGTKYNYLFYSKIMLYIINIIHCNIFTTQMHFKESPLKTNISPLYV